MLRRSAMNEPSEAYPVTLTGELTKPPGHWVWIFKWLLGIPHYIILAFLGIAYVVVWIISLFAILFTGRDPRWAFNYKLGVLRWAWRVGFYSYQALGTDKYPPFTLADVPDYPARLEIPYPEKLSHGLVVVKWWLLAIPHYIVTAFFAGGGGYRNGGLILVLAIFAGVVLLFTGKYPQDIFKLVIGLNRWVYRVFAYMSLMRDEYPPFRLWDD
jgi:hypothetical protein